MIIKFLGTAGEVLEDRIGCKSEQCKEEAKMNLHKRYSSILIEEYGTKIMVDCGLGLHHFLNEIQPDFLIITHAHPDHCLGLLGGSPVPVVLSRETDELLRYFPIDDKKRRVIPRKSTLKLQKLEFQFFPVVHSVKAPMMGMKIVSPNGGTAVYIPDCLDFRKKEEILKDADVYIGDGSSLSRDIIRRAGNDTTIGHASMFTQIKWCLDFEIPQIYFTHIGNIGITHEEALKRLKEVSENAMIVKDDDEIRVPRRNLMLKLPPPEAGIYLVEPHGKLVWEGKKSAIVKSTPVIKYVGKRIYLCSGSWVYGILILAEPKEISLEEFRRLYPKHLITEEERRSWWDDREPLYYYEIQSFEKFSKPRRFKWKPGYQTWIEKVEFLGEEPRDLHEDLHARFKNDPEDREIVELHARVSKLIPDHKIEDSLDYICLRFERGEIPFLVDLIQNIKDYDPYKENPSDRDNKVLADDWRIVCGWWSSLLSGKNIKFSREEILEVARKIYREIKRRVKEGKMKYEFHPENMKPAARDLLERIQELEGEK